ncbi:CotH kinase family protein [Crocinitomix sp.]|nr:CotH kinase family protein [Crocinitomix sp.]
MKKIFLVYLFIFSQLGFTQVLNEVCASNHGGFSSDLVGFADWLEIYNEDEEDLNLEGWHLTDNILDPNKWTFPNLEIEEGEYFTLFAKEETALDSVISFAFRKAGDTLYLLDPSYNIIDVLIHPALHSDDSYGRIGEQWYYFDTPSPNALNDTVLAYNGYSTAPTINRQSGVTSAGTHIVLRPAQEGGTVYYSMRGIKGDHLYESDLILSQTTNILAVAIADSMLPSTPVSRTYFINEQSSLPIVNLTVDSLSLYDEVTGITMMGPDAAPIFPYYGANFWKDIELNAQYEFFNSDFQLKENLDCDIKIHGGPGSRLNPLKSFQLQASDQQDELMFQQRYFAEKEVSKFNRLVLRNSGNDFCNTCMKDAALHRYFLENDLDLDLLGFQPVVFYINGNYQGILNMREKPDQYYVTNNYGYDSKNVNVLENWNLEVKTGTDESFRSLWYFARDNDLSDQENYNVVASQLDIASMMNYFIIEVYLNNRDWPNSNLRVWNVPGEKKWRYMCYDLDVSYRYNSFDPLDMQCLNYILSEWSDMNPHVSILNALFANSTFKHDFINRYCDLLNTLLKAENLSNGILEGKALVAEDMPKHFSKWCGNIDDWHERFNGNIGFINQRADIVRTELSELFEMPKSVRIRIDTYPKQADKILLNTIELNEFPFEGQYFTTNTIQITATENGGAKFRYWDNLRTGEVYGEKSIIIDPAEGDHFVAYYESQFVFGLNLFPNPIHETGTITYALPEPAKVSIEIYSLTGRRLYAYQDEEEKMQGSYEFNLLFTQFSPGMYYLKFFTAYGEETIKFVKL